VAGGWLLVTGCWLLVVGCWLLVAGGWRKWPTFVFGRVFFQIGGDERRGSGWRLGAGGWLALRQHLMEE
jgi:hypothetical protein